MEADSGSFEKVSTQGDFKRYINLSNTDLEYNATALALEMATRGGQQWSEFASTDRHTSSAPTT